MSDERLLYLTPHEKNLVETRFKIKLRLASEAQLPPPVAHPGLKNCGVKCYMNSVLQMMYSNPYIRKQVLKFTVPSVPPSPCNPSVSTIAEACVKALRGLFRLLTSGDQKFYDAQEVFAATNALLVERNIANINAEKIRKISRTLKEDDLSANISQIIQEEVTDTNRLKKIEELLKTIKEHQGKKKIKRNVENVFERLKEIVEDRSEAQQDADEFFLLILECMECYGLGRGINVNVTYRRFCVDDRGSVRKELVPRQDPPVKWLKLQGSTKKESIETSLEANQRPEIMEGWKNEDHECEEGDSLSSKLEYTTNESFDTLFLFNAHRANLFVPYELVFTGKLLLLKGACLYSGKGTSGHYVYADIISRTQGIVYDDQTTAEVSIDYEDRNVDLAYKTFKLSENAYFYMYVVESRQKIPVTHESIHILSEDD